MAEEHPQIPFKVRVMPLPVTASGEQMPFEVALIEWHPLAAIEDGQTLAVEDGLKLVDLSVVEVLTSRIRQLELRLGQLEERVQ